MITKVSYRPYTASVSNGQNKSQNVNFGAKLDPNTLYIGREFARDLIGLTQTHEPVTLMNELLKDLESRAGATMTVKELVAAVRESRVIPVISG